MPLISRPIFTFLMSSMVMYRRNNDHNVVGRDIWFRIRPNLGPFLVTFRFLLTSSEVPKFSNFCYYMRGSPEIGLQQNQCKGPRISWWGRGLTYAQGP